MDNLAPVTLREELGIALRIWRIRLRGQMTYRWSFWMQIAGNLLTHLCEVLALFVMFYRFDAMGGWSLGEVALLHGISMMAFSIGDSLTVGMDNVSRQIRAGEFDRTLLRPMNTWIASAVSDVSIRHIGETMQGVVIFAYANAVLDIDWTPMRLCVLVVSMVAGVALYSALFTVEAILSFWTVNGVEAINAFTYGGSDLSQFPLHIFNRWMRYLFLWLIPVGFISFYPALYLLGRKDPFGYPDWLVVLCPLMSAAFCLVVAWGWARAIRHYRSTGS